MKIRKSGFLYWIVNETTEVELSWGDMTLLQLIGQVFIAILKILFFIGVTGSLTAIFGRLVAEAIIGPLFDQFSTFVSIMVSLLSGLLTIAVASVILYGMYWFFTRPYFMQNVEVPEDE